MKVKVSGVLSLRSLSGKITGIVLQRGAQRFPLVELHQQFSGQTGLPVEITIRSLTGKGKIVIAGFPRFLEVGRRLSLKKSASSNAKNVPLNSLLPFANDQVEVEMKTLKGHFNDS